MSKDETIVKDGDGALFAETLQERNELRKKVVDLEKQMSRMEPMNTTFQPYIESPPVPPASLFGQACANDGVTVASWADTWIKHMHENKALADWKKDSAMNEYAKSAYSPVIIAGSGPSLKKNAHLLKDLDPRIKLVSCMHNFGYFEDLGVKPDYYVNLDAGDITMQELPQGGKRPEAEYWKATKNHTMVTAIHAHPEMHKRWKGKTLWFRTPMPDTRLSIESEKIGDGFDMMFQVGGNTLGACLYFARSVLGGCPIVFIGADFAFDRSKKFHPFDSPYDSKYAGLMPVTDIHGDRLYTWQSYYNFKCWMDFQALGGQGNNPGMFINCTEGGILGAYPEGNIRAIQQMSLEMFFAIYGLHKHLPECLKKKQLLF